MKGHLRAIVIILSMAIIALVVGMLADSEGWEALGLLLLIMAGVYFLSVGTVLGARYSRYFTKRNRD